jgi:hypothetical protein
MWKISAVFTRSSTMNAYASPIMIYLRQTSARLLLAALMLPFSVCAQSSDWSVGAYAGKYYDSEPAGFTQGNANFLEHYLVALTASKTLWRSASLPLSLEIDGMVGLQRGSASLGEIAVAPALRWSGFPWNESVHTSFSVAPLGISYTTSVSPLELGKDGRGSRTLSWLFLEVALSRPSDRSNEFFMRLHHRCAVYDKLNDFGANGEDFFVLGFRRRF